MTTSIRRGPPSATLDGASFACHDDGALIAGPLGVAPVQNAPRPQPLDPHRVHLGTEHGDLGANPDPYEHPDDDGESAVNGSRPLDLVADDIRPDELQAGPEDR